MGQWSPLAPQGWFRFTTQRDNLAVPDKKCKGMFWEWQGTLIFKPTKKIKIDEDWEAPPTRLVPIRWGKRRYLVREEYAQDFCTNVNLGDEPRTFWGVPYLRGDDFKLKVRGLPEVPDRWKRFLLQAPVTGKVTEALPDGRYRMDVGARGGLLAGMVMTVGEWDRNFTVESVAPDSAVVKMSQYGSRKALTVGQSLSTRYSI